MKGLKTILALLLALAMILSGCAANTSRYATTVAATYGDQAIYLDEANFWLRYEQMSYSYYAYYLYQYYGITDFYSQPSGRREQTYGESIKEDIMAGILQTCILLDHESEFDTSLNEKDKEKIEQTIKDLMSNYSDTLFTEKLVGKFGENELRAVLEKRVRALKVWDGVREKAVTSVSDGDADSFTVNYFLITSTDTATPEGSSELKGQTLAEFLSTQLQGGTNFDDLKAEFSDLTASTLSYRWNDTDSASRPQYKMGSQLTDGQVSCQEDGDYWYVVQCVDDHDPVATAEAKLTLESLQKEEHFNQVYAEWAKSAKAFTVKGAWNQLPIQ